MKRLALLALRILLVNLAVLAPSVWVLSQWYTCHLAIGGLDTELYVKCDFGGWVFDVRRPTRTVSWQYAFDLRQRSQAGDASIVHQNQSTIDAFDSAQFWIGSWPGIRWLHENGNIATGVGRRWAIGLRHPLLLVVTALLVCWYCWRQTTLAMQLATQSINK